jgi:hypothetical protein
MVATVVNTGAYITTSTCTKFRRRIAILVVPLSCLLSDLSLLQVLSDESKDVFYSVCRYQLDGKFAPPPSASAVNYAHLTATLGSEGKVGTPSPSPAVTPFRRTASLTGGDRGKLACAVHWLRVHLHASKLRLWLLRAQLSCTAYSRNRYLHGSLFRGQVTRTRQSHGLPRPYSQQRLIAIRHHAVAGLVTRHVHRDRNDAQREQHGRCE